MAFRGTQICWSIVPPRLSNAALKPPATSHPNEKSWAAMVMCRQPMSS